MRKPKKIGSDREPNLGKELTADQVKERRAKAFFEMEVPLWECFQRAEIVEILLGRERSDLAEEPMFEVKDMLQALMTNYRAVK
jgi:hypothetical protein